MTNVVEVAAGLIAHEGRYLIAKRRTGVHLAGLWEFPGGKREPGETLEECLQRELFEELSIRIDGPIPFRIILKKRSNCTSFGALSVRAGRLRWIAPKSVGSIPRRWDSTNSRRPTRRLLRRCRGIRRVRTHESRP
jgi:8-oxo-dGTP pyrophosphatase MutT (NUDIX family)